MGQAPQVPLSGDACPKRHVRPTFLNHRPEMPAVPSGRSSRRARSLRARAGAKKRSDNLELPSSAGEPGDSGRLCRPNFLTSPSPPPRPWRFHPWPFGIVRLSEGRACRICLSLAGGRRNSRSAMTPTDRPTRPPMRSARREAFPDARVVMAHLPACRFIRTDRRRQPIHQTDDLLVNVNGKILQPRKPSRAILGVKAPSRRQATARTILLSPVTLRSERSASRPARSCMVRLRCWPPGTDHRRARPSLHSSRLYMASLGEGIASSSALEGVSTASPSAPSTSCPPAASYG